ncbi:MAG: VOC family protein [Rhodobacter sp.]|nr:VOC family protein [Paracoccaceae bacterium]MCC0077175.1 VOC family protein [Rhodobacter sp.]
MTKDFHGLPCWYELTSPDTAAAATFYGAVLGWSWAKVPMEGMDYHLASMGPAMVAGMMTPPADGIPPNWCIYFAVTDCDATAAAVQADGGGQIVPPSDIPGTGRFAILTDPQGAVFGILQPLPMEDGNDTGRAFDQKTSGHGHWHELMTSDPAAAMAFYAKHLGWTASQAMDMGEMGTYQLFAGQGGDMGGIMRQMVPGMPSFWLPYFGANGIDAAVTVITAAGGKVQNGPVEVPGGAFILQATDPQGAWFALSGPR